MTFPGRTQVAGVSVPGVGRVLCPVRVSSETGRSCGSWTWRVGMGRRRGLTEPSVLGCVAGVGPRPQQVVSGAAGRAPGRQEVPCFLLSQGLLSPVTTDTVAAPGPLQPGEAFPRSFCFHGSCFGN